MSNRKIIHAASTSGIGYYPVASVNISDPYYDNVSLLLNGDTTVDDNFANVSLLLTGNDLLDKSNNRLAVTNTGSVTASSIFKKFGTGSIYVPTSSSYLTVTNTGNTLDLGTGDFTIEFWLYVTSFVDFVQHVSTRTSNSTTMWGIDSRANGTIYMHSSDFVVTSAAGKSANTWNYVTVVRQSGVCKMYINGTLEGTSTNSTLSTANFAAPSGVGVGGGAAGMQAGICYIDDLRITKGIARYTSNFTPPTQALPSNEILDSSVYRLPVTTYGNARIDNATKKFGTGSMYFDGTGDYLSIPVSSNTAINGTENFTVEAWLYLMVATSYHCFYSIGNWAVQLYVTSGGQISIYFSSSATGSSYIVAHSSTGTLTLNWWTHVVVQRAGNNFTIFLNGVLDSTYVSAGSIALDTTSQVGGIVGTYLFTGYIDDLRITKGYARYTANFTPPSAALPTIPPTIAADPWWGNVSLLLDGNTTDAYDPYWQNVSLMLTGDDFIDWSNQHNAMTGSATVNTTTKKFGTGSMYFNGSTNYLYATSSAAFGFGTDNFTVEAWVYPTSYSTYNYIFCTAITNGFVFYVTGNTLKVRLYNTGDVLSSSTIPALNTWTHVAAVRNGTSLQIFVNGVSTASATTSTNFATSTIQAIGGDTSSPVAPWAGYMDDLRITKGIARYTGNFTPPTAALPSYKIQDRTQNNLTAIPYGNVQLITDVKKNGTGSMFFGSGHVYFLNSDIFDLSNKDFTLEAWIYPVNFNDYGQIFSKRGASGRSWQLYTDSGTGCLSFSISSGQNHNSTSIPALNAWSHAALSYTYSDTTARLFLNGVLVYTLTSASFDHKAENIGVGSIPYPDGSQRFYGCIDDARITKGYARYTANFTPPSQAFATQYISTGFDPNYANVSLLLTGEGTNGSTAFTDLSSSPKTITAYGDTKISTAVKKYGTGSMYFDGGGDYLSIQSTADIEFGSGDFTIEFWWYPTSTARQALYHGSFGADYSIGIDYSSVSTNQKIGLWASSNGTSWNLINSDLGGNGIGTISITQNAWNHIAFVRSGTTWQLYINGVRDLNLTAISGSIVSRLAYPKVIGNWWTNAAMSQVYGYIDDIRITKGYARYTANFTPPTYALATTTGTAFDVNRVDTSLLLRGNGTNGSTSFTDESPNNLTVTAYGNAQISTAVKKYGTGSMYFDGTGDYTTHADNQAVSFGTGDFTIESWVNWSAVGTQTAILLGKNVGWVLYMYPAGYLVWGSSSPQSGTNMIMGSTLVTTGSWFHIAVTRASGTVKIFINGVMDGSGSTTDSFNYSANGHLEVGGSHVGNPNFNGYIDDVRITKGYARYTANFTPPTYEDPIVTGTQYDENYAQVSLLLNGDGTNGSQVFTDLSSRPKTITNTGSVTVNTSVKKFGTGSMKFSGSNYLITSSSSDLGFGTGNFTIEFWYYPLTRTSTYPQILNNSAAWGTNAISLSDRHGDAPTKFTFDINNYSATRSIVSNTVVVENTWYYLAIVRNGTNISLYVNGIYDNGITTSVSVDGGGPIQWRVGSENGNANTFLNGYIDDLRITKGLARYTQNFTPPTAPLPTSGGY